MEVKYWQEPPWLSQFWKGTQLLCLPSASTTGARGPCTSAKLSWSRSLCKGKNAHHALGVSCGQKSLVRKNFSTGQQFKFCWKIESGDSPWAHRPVERQILCRFCLEQTAHVDLWILTSELEEQPSADQLIPKKNVLQWRPKLVQSGCFCFEMLVSFWGLSFIAYMFVADSNNLFSLWRQWTASEVSVVQWSRRKSRKSSISMSAHRVLKQANWYAQIWDLVKLQWCRVPPQWQMTASQNKSSFW